jgi:hypothetical protein
LLRCMSQAHSDQDDAVLEYRQLSGGLLKR